ncbi:MAG: acyl-CoA/acyl-ACP dehydrogenase [Thermomicrobiales bacterium]|nr:acyl-CoA/acyl-ACP dehydrogenase [Thermomicrobiales bacterium]
MQLMTAAPANTFRPAPLRQDDDRFVELAADLAERFRPHAAEHDRDNTFVDENFRIMNDTGYLRLAVPVELGGLGASMRQVCYAQAALAAGCASTALAVNMHHYLVLANVFRWRKGAAAAEGLLRRVANDGVVLMTSGGSDGIWPSATAVKENGGYRISGRKVFCSQAPVAGVLTTMAAYDDPQDGRIVLLVGIPMSSPGVEILDTWDTMGMRATASQDVQLTDVMVGEGQVAARRPWGKVDPALQNAGIHFAPPVASVYYGVAMAARDEAVRIVSGRKDGDGVPMTQDATVQRQVGLMDYALRTSWWSLMGALDEMGDDYAPSAALLGTLMLAKRHVITAAQEVVELAMSIAGGGAYFKRSPLEMAYRDVRAGAFHPLNPEKTLLHIGRSALGEPVEKLW